MAVCTWKPVGGTDTAAVRLANAWKALCVAAFLAALNYESNNFQKGIDHAGIIAASKVLVAPLEIDPRGGFIGQDEFEVGLQLLASNAAPIRVGLEQAAAAKGITFASVVTLTCFKMKRRAWLKQGLVEAGRCEQNSCRPYLDWLVP